MSPDEPGIKYAAHRPVHVLDHLSVAIGNRVILACTCNDRNNETHALLLLSVLKLWTNASKAIAIFEAR